MIKKLFDPLLFTISIMLTCAFGLGLMFILEVFLDFRPCFLCTIQRWLTLSIIALAVTSLLLYKPIGNKYNDKLISIFLFLISLVLLVMSGIAIYQVLVEHGIVQMSWRCQSKDFLISDTSELLRSMETGGAAPPCDRPQFLLNISIASWTLLGLVVIDMIMALYWFSKIAKRKE